MATLEAADKVPSTFHTVFLIPNLHCPTCVTRIETILADLEPAPSLVNVSIISHSVTVEHGRQLWAVAIIHALSAAGYEVFDVVLDAASDESLSFLHATDLQAAVMRWDPRRPSIASSAHEKHALSCQMCAAHHTATDGTGPDEVVAAPPSTGDFIAVFAVEGMTCASCTGNVTRALLEVASVSQAEVALVNHSATVHFNCQDPDNEKLRLVEAIEDIGYGAEVVEMKRERLTTKPKDENGPDSLWQATYSIEGMSCTSCINTITSTLKQLEFVQSTDINLVQHSGTVTFKGRQNASTIQEAIENAGYDATETDLKSLVRHQTPSISRSVSLSINGMYCSHCPERLASTLRQLPVEILRMPTIQNPILTISYTPDVPTLSIRSIMHKIGTVDKAFTVSIYQPPSVEERSLRMLLNERRVILARTVFCLITAIPTFIVGIVYMSLVPHSDPGARYLMTTLRGVSRAEWATFVMATPVYFFATDYFHRRTIKEIYTTWKPKSTVPLLRRFYRFGSMNMLISLGTTIAYFASLAELIIKATMPRGSAGASQSAYFDSVVFLTMFLLLGRYAEANMKAKSGDAISALGNLRPAEAMLQKSDDEKGAFENVKVELVDIGDVVRIPHGSSPPCDGSLVDNAAELDESSLTGESVMVRKKAGDILYSGTINKGPAVSIRVTGHAGASMLDSIIQVVREGQSKRAPVERVADILTAYFVPTVVLIAISTWVIWLSLGLSGALPQSYLDNDVGGWPFWSLQFAIAVFVIACPCGLGLAAPTALFVGGGMAAKRGILVKGGGEAFQEASGLDCVVFDKTGTLTEGAEPKIVQHTLYPDPSLGQNEILGMLKAAEENSSHPLGKAAIAFVAPQASTSVRVSSVEEIPGKGLSASFVLPGIQESMKYETLVGNESLMQDHGIKLPIGGQELLESWKGEGNSILISAVRKTQYQQTEWRVTGMFAATDSIRQEASDVVSALQARNIDVWMLSGDNPKTAIAVAAKVGIPSANVFAGVLPAEKAEKIKYLQKTLPGSKRRGWANRLIRQHNRAVVGFVGDGINDAPALAAADVGIAVASGSDVAVQSASFILVHSDLRAVLSLVTLSKAVFQRVILNFFWAAVYNLVALPVAAGVLYPVSTGNGGHVRLNPAWAALAMALSSISVVGSSLLLRSRLPVIGCRG